MRVYILILLCSLLLQSCDSEPSKTEVVTKALTSGPWEVSSVMVDGSDQTDLYKDLLLTFTQSTYSTTNGGPMWPASGSWSFQSDAASVIVRNDDLEIEVVKATKDELVISFFWSETVLGPGRTNAMEGEHTFTFTH